MLNEYQVASIVLGFGSALVFALPAFRPPPKRDRELGITDWVVIDRLLGDLFDSWRFARQATAIGLALLILSLAFQLVGGFLV